MSGPIAGPNPRPVASPLSVSINSDDLIDLKSYRSQIENSKYLDGDIINNGKKLSKINFGSGFVNILSLGISGRRTRGTPEQNLKSRAMFWLSLRASGSFNENEIEQIRKNLGLEFTEKELEGGKKEYKFTSAEEKGSSGNGTDALSRRTIAHFVEAVDAKTQQDEQAGAPKKAGAPKTYIGGKLGLNLTENQFKGIFDQLVDRGLAKAKLNEVLAEKGMATDANRALYGKIVNTLLQECRHRFSVGVSDGLFEKVFSDGLGIDAIAKKVANLAVDMDASFVPGGSTVGSLGKSRGISEDARMRIDKYSKDLERHGADGLSDVTKLGDGFKTQAENVTKDKSALMAADLLFNSDTTEVDKLGFADGRRIANILMKDLETFQALCQAVKSKGSHQVFERLAELDPKVADVFRNLIATVNAKCFGDGIPADADAFKKLCVAEFGTILKVTSSSVGKTLESAIDKAASDFILKNTAGDEDKLKTVEIVMSKTGHSPLMARLGLAIGLYKDDGTVLDYHKSLAAVMSAQLDKSVEPHDLRRMLAAGFRFSGKTNANVVSFDESRIVMEMGPMALKLLQSVGGVPDESMKTALAYVRGNLRRIDAEMVKAQLVEHLNKSFSKDELANIKDITIDSSLGAASIAEAFSATIHYNDKTTPPVSLVVKLVRPDVKTKFESEAKAYLDKFSKNVELLSQLLTDAVSPNQDPKKILDRYKEYLNAQGKTAIVEKLKEQAYSDNLQGLISDELAAQASTYTELLSLKTSVGKEFDFTKEAVTALKSYAAFLDGSNAKSMELVLKDPTKKGEFDGKLRELMNKQRMKDENNVELKNFDYDTALKELAFGKQVNGELVGGYLVRSSESCFFCKKVDNAMSVDKFLSQENVKPEDLAKLQKNLLELVQTSVNNLINGHPPVLHLDMHGSNIMTDGSSITLIDHGKECNISKEEQKIYSTLMEVMSGSDEMPGRKLHEVYVSLLKIEKAKEPDHAVVIDRALGMYGEGEDKEKAFAKDVMGIDYKKDKAGFEAAFGVKNKAGEWVSVEGNKKDGGGSAGIKWLNDCVEKLEDKGVFVPSSLSAFNHTFLKLNSTIENVENKITEIHLQKEIKVCEKILDEVYEKVGNKVNEAENATKASQDPDQRAFEIVYNKYNGRDGLRENLNGGMNEIKKNIKDGFEDRGAGRVFQDLCLTVQHSFENYTSGREQLNVQSDKIVEKLKTELLNEVVGKFKDLYDNETKDKITSESQPGHSKEYEDGTKAGHLVLGSGVSSVECSDVNDVFMFVTAQLKASKSS